MDAYEFSIILRDQVTNTLKSVNAGLDSMHQKIMNQKVSWANIGNQFIAFNQASQLIESANRSLENLTRPGLEYQSALADMKAITGLADQQIKELGNSARATGREFGTDAAKGVESYKLLLSQLNPELAKSPEVLSRMSRNTNILAKTMQGDVVAATEVLTTAMNQFQVDTNNPIQAVAEMEKMMNAMSAAAQEGSAELPAIKAALEQSGMAAKTAGVGFEETNSAIQILDRSGKKFSEGGVALRNVLSTLSQGRFLPPDVQEELRAAEVDINQLGNESLTLSQRLRPLQGVLSDSALMLKIFGKDNYASAIALISNVDAMDEMTKKITGTNTAVEQAEIIMGTHEERMKRLSARFKDFGVSVFNTTKNVLPFTAAFAQSAQIITQFVPLMSAVKGGFIKAYQEAAKMTTWIKGLTAAQLKANLAFLASPLGIITMTVMAAAGAYLLLRKRIDEATVAQKTLSQVKQSAEHAIVAEKLQVTRLTAVMQDNNATLDQKKAAYTRLIEISPEYYAGLTFEEAQTNKLVQATASYIDELRRKAIATASEEKLVELEKRKIDIESDASLTDLSFWQKMKVAGVMNTVGPSQAVSYQESLRKANKESELSMVKAQEDAILKNIEKNHVENTVKPVESEEFNAYKGFGKTGGGEGEGVINSGVSSITSGGTRATNINITIASMLEDFTIHVQNTEQGISELKDKVIEAIMKSINSAQAISV